MLVFPQLTTGAATLYPTIRSTLRRTVINTLGDGNRVAYADPDFGIQAWELRLSGLNGSEWSAIQELFEATKGALDTFTFLEPAGNLLAASEAFDSAIWTKDPLVTTAGSIADPLGTTRAMHITNGAATLGGFTQSCALPGSFQYCLSAWGRGAGSTITLTAATTGASSEKTFSLTSSWRRFSMSVALGQATGSVAFGARLGAGVAVDLFGMQVDAQPAASAYQRTSSGGIHSNARFEADEITFRAQGTDNYDSVIRVVSKGS